MKRLLAALISMGCISALAAASLLESVEILPAKDVSFATPTVIPLESAGIVSVALELGDSLDNLTLRLHPQSGVKTDFVVEQSYETSLTIMEEGPHLDLLNWKHYNSPWRPLKKLNATDFRIPSISAEESQQFPKVTPKEIQAIVTKEGGARLGKYVSKVKGPTDYPCGVGVSKIRFRIKVKDDAGEKVIKTMEFLVPMGC